MQLFIAFVLLLVAQAYAIPKGFTRETNGQRIARGLPPLPAKFGRVVPGDNQLYKPTPASQAKRSASPSPSASPSAAALLTYIGRINVRSEDGSSLGYIKTSGGVNELNQTPGDDDLYVRITANTAGKPTDLIGMNIPTGPSLLGAKTSSSELLAARSPSTVDLTTVRQTIRGGLPARSVDTTYSSGIWSMDLTTKELTAHWINVDGSKPDTSLAYDGARKALFLTGDIDAYNSESTTKAVPVCLYMSSE